MFMKNEVVLITGASAGIGRATAHRFQQAGAKLILVARREERLRELAAELSSDGVLVAPLDITDALACKEFLTQLPSEFSSVSVLVNNAGMALGTDPAWLADLQQWEEVVELNIFALLRLTRKILPQMVERGHGHVINIGSVAGTYPYPGGNLYGATKAFVEQFSHNLRCDLHGTGVRVTNIEPGLVETEFSLVRFQGDVEKAAAVYEGIEAMTAEDVAEAIFWSASVPKRVNINRIEMMATAQSMAGFRFSK